MSSAACVAINMYVSQCSAGHVVQKIFDWRRVLKFVAHPCTDPDLFFPVKSPKILESWRGGRVAEGGGLENRRAKAPWVRILPPPPPFVTEEILPGEMAEWSKAPAC